MTNLISNDVVRDNDTEYLKTDGISEDTITKNIADVQIKVLNQVGHLYDLSEITAEELPSELALAIKDWSTGQIIIKEYPSNKDAFEKGKLYREDARDLLKNIIESKRKFKDLPKQVPENTIVSSIVSTKSCIDKRSDNFIDNLKCWD